MGRKAARPPAGARRVKGRYRNLTRLLVREDGLIERAEAALLRTVAADPEDAAALLQLGDVQRGKGQLDEALACYRRVLSLRPDDAKALWLTAVLSGQPLPEAPVRDRPPPFVRRPDFLPPRQCQALLSHALANRERLAPAVVGGPRRVDPSARRALTERAVTVREVQPWFEAPLRSAFREALPRMGMPEPSEYWVEMAMSAYLGGGFFAEHVDAGPGFRTRRLSFAYYFHAEPRRFRGGELLLHDGDGQAGTFTRIEPQHNSIVFYPAWALHQIAAVEGDIKDFRDARFAIHGWLRTYQTEQPT